MNRTRFAFFLIILIPLLVSAGVVLIEINGSLSDIPLLRPFVPRVSLTIASSSTKRDWLDQTVERFNDANITTATGKRIVVEVSHVTSGGSQNDIQDGALQPVVWSPGDQSWVGQINETWQQRHNKRLISQDCLPTVYAPIGFAMWRPMAEALGWPDAPIGWDTMVNLAADPAGWGTYGHPEWGVFRFGHTHPGYSNSGLLSMTAFAYGIAGHDTPLTPAAIYAPELEGAMRTLEQVTAKYGRQSSALFEMMAQQGPSYVHAIAASEETTLRYNLQRRDELRFPLVFIFPSGGTIWADHPYCILDQAEWVNDEQIEAATHFRDYLLSSESQALAIHNRLRPLDPNIALHAPFNLETGTNPDITPIPLPSPSAEVSEAIIDLFLTHKRRATILVVLDVSGSMQGEKIRAATSATSEFLKRLHVNDHVGVLTFSDDMAMLSAPNRVGDIVEETVAQVNTLIAHGGTALYDTVCQATALMTDLQTQDLAVGENKLYGIVLLSDGEDSGSTTSENRMFTTCLPAQAEADGIKIFPIAFGEDTNEAVLNRIAQVTGGRAFTADPASIDAIYLSISAEQ